MAKYCKTQIRKPKSEEVLYVDKYDRTGNKKHFWNQQNLNTFISGCSFSWSYLGLKALMRVKRCERVRPGHQSNQFSLYLPIWWIKSADSSIKSKVMFTTRFSPGKFFNKTSTAWSNVLKGLMRVKRASHTKVINQTKSNQHMFCPKLIRAKILLGQIRTDCIQTIATYLMAPQFWT